jgi:hypothetical protein
MAGAILMAAGGLIAVFGGLCATCDLTIAVFGFDRPPTPEDSRAAGLQALMFGVPAILGVIVFLYGRMLWKAGAKTPSTQVK